MNLRNYKYFLYQKNKTVYRFSKNIEKNKNGHYCDFGSDQWFAGVHWNAGTPYWKEISIEELKKINPILFVKKQKFILKKFKKPLTF